MNQNEANQILDMVRESALRACPDLIEKTMYGGTVFVLESVKPKALVCGVFLRKGYVTIEFSRGNEIEDTNNLLEGEGKDRRHLKLSNTTEYAEKQTDDFIEKAIKLY